MPLLAFLQHQVMTSQHVCMQHTQIRQDLEQVLCQSYAEQSQEHDLWSCSPGFSSFLLGEASSNRARLMEYLWMKVTTSLAF